MIADITNILDIEPEYTIEDGIIRGENLSYRTDENNFGKVLLDGMRENPTFISQIDSESGKEDSFGEMADRTVKCALWLISQGIESGDVVAICSHNQLDSPIPILASLCIGAVFNPWWDHGLTKDTARHFIKLTKPKVLFTDEKYTDLVSNVVNELDTSLKIVVFENTSSDFETFHNIMEKYESTNDIENFQCIELSSMDVPAYIEYTSGSTGLPKGALHSHRSLFGNITNTGSFGAHQISLCYSNLCWISGILCTFASIAYYNRRIISTTFTPENFCQLVENYKVTWILTGTSSANRLLKSEIIPNYDVSSVKSIWVGGATLKKETLVALCEAFVEARVVQLYGATEMGGCSVHQTKTDKPNSLGTIARGFEIKIIDPETENILNANEKGEICVRAPFMMIGYYRNPEKTKEAIKSDGFLYTGDLGYYDDDGAIYIIDRLKELIKWRGHHVSPSVVEQHILKYPGVVETAVVGVPDWEDDERPIAFITKAPNVDINEEEIMKFVEENLPEQMWLKAGVQIIEQMPYTASGKVARTEIKQMAQKFIRDA